MKTVDEWAQAFNLLYNNIASDKAPGLDPYEISVFLTRAQRSIVVGLYNGSFGNAFESTEEITNYLDSLVKQLDCEKIEDASYNKISEKSQLFKNPDDLLFRTLEYCTVEDCNKIDMQIPVIPITQDEYFRTIRNPFKTCNNRKALRLAYSKTNQNESGVLSREIVSEIIADRQIKTYSVRYMSAPSPIILTDLTGTGLSIEGKTDTATCLLPESLHEYILSEAVKSAKMIWNA